MELTKRNHTNWDECMESFLAGSSDIVLVYVVLLHQYSIPGEEFCIGPSVKKI